MLTLVAGSRERVTELNELDITTVNGFSVGKKNSVVGRNGKRKWWVGAEWGETVKKTNIHYKVSMDNYDFNSAIMGGFPCYGLHFLIIYHSLISQPLLQLGDRHEAQVQNFSNLRTMQHFSTQGITACGGREQNSSLGIYGDSTSLDLTNGDHAPEPHAPESRCGTLLAASFPMK